MFFKQNIYKKILNEIIKFNTIVIARHVGPDPDALGSSLGLKQIINDNFIDKKVYAIGNPTSRFNFIGEVDKIPSDLNNDEVLLIVVDTPDHRRVDGVDPRNFKNSIKIDHHPFIEKTCDLEWIEDTSSSAAQMILDFVFNTGLKLSKEASRKLYIGITADTNRFMFSLVARMLEETNLDITEVYEKLYMRDYKEIKFGGYMAQNFNITDSKVGYIIIGDDKIKEYGVDPATPGNMINNFNYINDFFVWLTATEDKELKTYRISVRSRGPIINKTLELYGGGGHIYASGARLKDEEEIMSLIEDLNRVCEEYMEKI